MRIVLYNDIVFARSLTYEQGVQALRLASNSFAVKFVEFSLKGVCNEDGWQLVGRPLELSKAFVDQPEMFVIDLED